jgi:uncharacterized cupredoxin-like copper-binding protein
VKKLTYPIAVLLLLGLTSGCAPTSEDKVTIRIHYSHFEPNLITVRAGVPMTITLRNDDPIDHEWIVGSPDVHEMHRHGTDAVHVHLPTEVTVPALSTRVTTVTFKDVGETEYICHLPGHEEYGMTGTFVVRA